MSETTILTKSTTRSVHSLRTTLPSFLVRLFKLEQGDKLEWILETDKKELGIRVKPIKKQQQP